MKVKTSDLIGPALDWSVAMCEGASNLRRNPHRFNNAWIVDWPGEDSAPTTDYLSCFDPSSDWDLGGPIIDRERMNILDNGGSWSAYYSRGPRAGQRWQGPSPLIAAMRCYVAGKLGDAVEIPDELINAQG